VFFEDCENFHKLSAIFIRDRFLTHVISIEV
jgi:hypothetical protein